MRWSKRQTVSVDNRRWTLDFCFHCGRKRLGIVNRECQSWESLMEKNLVRRKNWGKWFESYNLSYICRWMIFFYQNLSLHPANVTFPPGRRTSGSWSCCHKLDSSSAERSFQLKIKPSVPRSAWDGDGLLQPTPRWCLTNCVSSGVRCPIKLLSRYDADINDCCYRDYCLAW